MDIKWSLNPHYVKLINKLNSKYPELMSAEGIAMHNFDMIQYTERYRKSKSNADTSIDDNANLGKYKTVSAFINGALKPYTKMLSYYFLWERLKDNFSTSYADEVITRVVTGDIYIHDSTNMIIPYCFNYTCYDIVMRGLPEWMGVSNIKAPTTLVSFVRQMANFLIGVATSQKGATGVADLNIFVSWFVQRILNGESDENGNFKREDYVSDEVFERNVWTYAYTQLRTFMYDINFNYKIDESLFTNVSLYDNDFLVAMLEDIKMPSTNEENTKIDIEVVKKVQVLYCEIYTEMLKTNVIAYPVTTACFSISDLYKYTFKLENGKTIEIKSKELVSTKSKAFFDVSIKQVKADDIKVGDIIITEDGETKVVEVVSDIQETRSINDEDFVRLMAKYNIEKQWCSNYYGKTSVMSSCCRLRSNKDEFDSYNSITGSASSKIGSIGVSTMNMPRIAYNAKLKGLSNEEIKVEVEKIVDMTMKINYCKRLLIQENIDAGMLPVYTDGYMDIDRQFLTTGVIGIYEFAEHLNYDIATENGTSFVLDILNAITARQDFNRDNIEQFKTIRFNMEQVPGESASVKLCQKDKLLNYDVNTDIYSNQFIPLKSNINMLSRIKYSGALDSQMSGGSMLHICMERPIENIDDYVELHKEVAKSGINTWAINHVLGECPDCKKIDVYGNDDTICHFCKSNKLKTYTRIVGYFVEKVSASQTKIESDFKLRHQY